VQNQFNTANDTQVIDPQHSRRNYLLRMDAVTSNSIRFSGRVILDRNQLGTVGRFSE
jgi:hypothetical protein